jgi:hypothetical protein
MGGAVTPAIRDQGDRSISSSWFGSPSANINRAARRPPVDGDPRFARVDNGAS